jgi:hypothetical protein
VEKTTRPFRYDLNQILYDYIVEMRNRFKGLDLIDCQMNYGWRFMTLYRTGIKTITKKKKCKKAKWLSGGSLTNSCKMMGSKKQKRKENVYPFECRVPKNSKER